jgi:50S ribosomal protein L16 3-hydroxylase
MTYSVGFRAPSRSELIGGWCDDLLAEMQDDDRYEDPDLRAQDNPGEISAAAIGHLHAMITETIGNCDAFARWFGAYNSTPKYPDMDWRPEEPIGLEALRENLAGEVPLCRNPASRFSFVRRSADSLLLFVDGECFECAGETTTLAEQLCAQTRITIDPDLMKSDSAMALIAKLFNQGSLAFEPED